MSRRPVVTSLVSVLIGIAARGAAYGQVTFDPPAGFRAGNGAMSVVSGDFDRDGHRDIVVLNRFSSALSVYRGDGRGGFAHVVDYPTGARPWGLLTRDLNEDGLLDLVSANRDSNDVSVSLGDGTAHFAATPRIPAGSLPVFVEAADLDGDGHLDLVTTNNGSADVSILVGDGFGGFTQIGRAATGQYANSVAAADFDHDSDFDLAVANWGTGDVVILDNDGAAQFTNAGALFTAVGSRWLVIADLDGDSNADIVVANQETDSIPILFGDGAGSFPETRGIASGNGPDSVIAADFDLDGVPDVAVTDYYGGDVSVHRGTGNRSFETDGARFAVGAYLSALIADDFNEDGLRDLVVTNIGNAGNNVAYLRNTTFSGCLAGNVNSAAGTIADVLFVNDSAGAPARRVELFTHEPLVVFMNAPPAATEPASFMLGAWSGVPRPPAARILPYGVGISCMPMPLSEPSPRLRAVWNNTPWRRLGVPTLPSSAAPSEVFSRRNGLGRRATFFLQGLIRDSASPQGVLAVTNGIVVSVR